MMRETARRVSLLAGTAFRVSPGRSLTTFLLPLSGVIGILAMIAVATLVNGVLAHDTFRVVWSAALVVAVFPVTTMLAMVGQNAVMGLSEAVGFAFDRQIAGVVATIPGLEHHERADVADQLQILRASRGALGEALQQTVFVANAVVTTVVLLVALATVEPRLLVIVAFGAPALIGARLRFRWRRAGEDASAVPGRLARHLTGLATAAQAGMELRVFGLRDEIRSRLRTANRQWRAPYARAELRCTLSTLAEDGLFALALTGLLGWLLVEAVHGHVSIGILVLAAYGAINIQRQVAGTAAMAGSLSDSLRAAGRVLWLREAAERIRADYRGQDTPPGRLSSGLRLDAVSFRYPGSDGWALSDVSVDIPAGSVIALVGENGAGKSTLVKLLLGLYRPTTGQILFDGTDLASYNIDAWRAATTGAFQDFARFEFTVQQAVGVGALHRIDDTAAVDAALRDAGAAEISAGLPLGLDTQLGAGWDGGADLSGGQWQKLALARGLMRREPLLEIFDEPTASLDAPTEHALFERYTAAARAGRQRGAITVLVTHRFSTVTNADLIIVLTDGRITELGSHAELLRRDGHYAELYELHASGYR